MAEHTTFRGLVDHIYNSKSSDTPSKVSDEKKAEWFQNGLGKPTDTFSEEQEQLMYDVWLPQEPGL